jgi:aminoglycoside phosphotransferase (APT) family kinase protein
VLAHVAAELHRTLLGFSATLAEPTDDGYLYGYHLDLEGNHGIRERYLVFVEDSPRSHPRRGVISVPIDGTTASAAVWIYPSDPALPALRELTEVASADRVLASLGITARTTAVEVVSYRPGRRAVVRVTGSGSGLFLKVVEPVKAESIAERHALFRSNGLPVPRLLGWSDEGVIAMSELPGVDAQSAIARMPDHATFLDQVEFLTTVLAEVPAFNTARPSLFDRLDWYITRLSEQLPDQTRRIALVGEAISEVGARGRDFDLTPVTIHGDLHLGQLFVDAANPSLITGMLDIDTAGSGDPADDAAAFYAHLVALGETAASFDHASAAQCFRLADGWLARWPRHRSAGFSDRARAIAATHLFGHALRPLSADWDAMSRRLLDRAEALVT